MRWTQAQPQGRARKPCEGHTCSVIDRKIYILFGKHEDESGAVVCPPLQVLDTESMSVCHPLVEQGSDGRTSLIPDDREGHTASVVGQSIWIFGGTWTDDDERTIYMNDLHVLDVNHFAWSRPSWVGTPPIEREGHSASVVGPLIYFFAGTWVDVDDEETSVYLNDLHVLDTHSNSWSQPITSGKAPSQREGHSATVVALRVLVFGGAGLDKEDTSVNLCDLHVLDTPTLAWSQPATAGRPPQERRYHSATSVDGVILVFGGQYYDCEADLHFECSNAVHELEVASLRWRECTIEGAAPLRRACHSSVAIGKQVYVVGGRYWDVAEDDYIFLNDVQVLDTSQPANLATDWRRFLNNPLLSDVTLRVGEQLIPAHRVVLAARCRYFERMFESGMREATQEVVLVEDVTPAVFLLLLDHLYTDAADVTADSVLELLAAADRFGIERLKKLCSDQIQASLSVDNVCEVLTIADRHSEAELVQSCVGFIVGHFAEVHRTEGFRHVPRDLLDVVHAAISARLFPGNSAAGSRSTGSTRPASARGSARDGTVQRQNSSGGVAAGGGAACESGSSIAARV